MVKTNSDSGIVTLMRRPGDAGYGIVCNYLYINYSFFYVTIISKAPLYFIFWLVEKSKLSRTLLCCIWYACQTDHISVMQWLNVYGFNVMTSTQLTCLNFQSLDPLYQSTGISLMTSVIYWNQSYDPLPVEMDPILWPITSWQGSNLMTHYQLTVIQSYDPLTSWHGSNHMTSWQRVIQYYDQLTGSQSYDPLPADRDLILWPITSW